MIKKAILSFLSICAVFSVFACGTTQETTTTASTIPIPPELLVTDVSQNDVYYEIFVRSFADSDGNGVGDFNGVTAKLDYLQDLGITAIWLMPITNSPSYHGYDVTDYYAVNPDYGTMQDFEDMVLQAQAHGIDVMIDMVFNHTSSSHPWFQAALNGEAPYHDYYHLVSAASSPGGPWYASGAYKYYAYFSRTMPDLNFENPVVMEEILAISAFWIDKGVKGFRLDAVHHYFGVIEDPGVFTGYQDNIDWLAEYKALLDEYAQEEIYILGEIYEEGQFATVADYYGGLDSPLDFPVSALLRDASGNATNPVYVTLLKRFYNAYRAVNPDFISFPFIVNHDMDRLATLHLGNADRIRLAAEMLLTLPGNPIIYYGEEIGMYGTKAYGPTLYDETRRLPIPWGDALTTDWLTVTDPILTSVNDLNATIDTVEEQLADPGSLLQVYKTLLAVRSANIALRYGNSLVSYEQNSPEMQGFYRECYVDGEHQKILVLHNFTGNSVPMVEFSGTLLYVSGMTDLSSVTDIPARSTVIIDVTPGE